MALTEATYEWHGLSEVLPLSGKPGFNFERAKAKVKASFARLRSPMSAKALCLASIY